MLLKDVLNVEGSQIYQSILQEGGTKRSHHMLVLQGTRRFGPPGEKTRSKIEAITDLDRLDALSLRLLEVNSWQELLAEDKAPKPSPRRPKKRKGS